MKSHYLLFKHRRFLPIFLTQFQGALTDNLIKNMLILTAAFEIYANAPGLSEMVIAVSGALLMLPFFLFSSISGQIADRFDKAIVTRFIKGFEVCLMLLAVYGFMNRSVTILLIIVFLLGLHSTFFGPIKYSILPQHLEERELLAGNAFIEGGTFIAILAGCILGNELPLTLKLDTISQGAVYVALLGACLSAGGFFISFFIPSAPSMQKDLKISFNIFRSTKEIIKYSQCNKKVFRAIMAISWFWTIGMAIMTLLPNFVKDFLNAAPSVYTFFLIVFTVGIAIGSLLCEVIMREKIHTRYVPVGGLGMTIFIILLFYLSLEYNCPENIVTLWLFLLTPWNWIIVLDILAISLFSGFYVVPLNTLVQQLSEKAHMSRVIASNNIFNSVYMVAGTILFTICINLGMSIPYFLLCLGISNFIFTTFIIRRP
ncbi:MAG TPA: MFS transporter [Lentisphaeria bacterium]|nr:MAG: hypothetical protein A2X47_09760 [Lentisphaerae bacterium GWF2_38_69]HBM16620.1 MFS transporter [Lentisphaeria bacterium]